MASVTEAIFVKKDHFPAAKQDWMLANPLLWLAGGIVCTLWSWLWTLAYGDNASDKRVIVLALGLLLASVGVWLRWRDRDALYLRAWHAPIALGLGCFFALVFLGVTALFLASCFVDEPYVLKPPPAFLIWISSAPVTFLAAKRCLSQASRGKGSASAPQTDAEEENPVDKEISLAFLALAVACIVGIFTLFADRSDPTDWDSMRLFLRVATAACLYAATLPLISTALRRLMLSGIITVHFMGINTAALSAPPAPWIMQQAWMRVFRPYLEFAYLNNAYHFYAPEPGSSSYLWFRIIYVDPATGDEDGMWYKVPQLDDQGRIGHPVALDYQRFLSLTEAVAHVDSLPPEGSYNKDNLYVPNPFWSVRLSLANEEIMIGDRTTHPRIKLLPNTPYQQQVRIPNDGSRRLLASYARFVAGKFADHPDPHKSNWKFKSVKIYQVVHTIPSVQWFLNRIPPTEPDLYRPFYLGHYNARGIFSNEGDPYLYWLLPSIRDDANDPDSQIRDYARLHAGDRQWIRRGSDRKWVEPKDRDIPGQPPR